MSIGALAVGYEMLRFRVISLATLAVVLLFSFGFIESDLLAEERLGDTALRELVNTPGHFLIMRHAMAPGIGDPENFQVEDCSTQRNLSEAGRRQAQRTGEMLRSLDISDAKIFSSRWCRCLETARLLELGSVVPMDSLNSFFREWDREKKQIAQLRADIAAMDLSGPVVLVTHQVVISGIAETSTRSGEIIVMHREAPDKITVVGSIAARALDE